jgi:hypothetical protein
MAGTRGFTIGIDYLYGHYATSSGILSGFYAMGDTLLPGSNGGVFGPALLYEKSELLLIQPFFRRSVVEGEPPPLVIHAKPALHINRQWTVFYRFDRLHPRLGPSSMVEHAVGLKFRPQPHIAIQAEFVMKRIDAPSLDVGGFRIGGTLRF